MYGVDRDDHIGVIWLHQTRINYAQSLPLNQSTMGRAMEIHADAKASCDGVKLVEYKFPALLQRCYPNVVSV
jgi:hypothetical protein